MFWPQSIFCHLKNGQKSIFELGKSLKLPKMQFHIKMFWFIWFHEFFWPGFFKIFCPALLHQLNLFTFVSGVSSLFTFFLIPDLSLMNGLSRLKPLLNTKMLWEWPRLYLVCYHKISKSTKKNGKLFQVTK